MTSSNKIILLSIAVSIGIIYRKESGDWPYVIMLVGSGLGLILHLILIKDPKIFLFLNPGEIRKGIAFRYLNACWVFLFISWVYGAVIGLLNSNATENVFRNFFGLNMYLLMPLLYTLKPTRKNIYYALGLGCIAQCAIAASEIAKHGMNFVIIDSFSEARIFISIGLITAFPFFGYYFSRLLFPAGVGLFDCKKRGVFFYLTGALVLTFFIIIPTASKGFLLAWVFCVFYVIYLYFFIYIKNGRITMAGIVTLPAIVLFFLVISFEFWDIIVFSYSFEEVSNATRLEQFEFLVEDLSFFGNGLGALLSSGYVRDKTGYGMELTYLNLIHKLGFFSIFLFLSYFFTYVAAFKVASKYGRIHESCFAFSGLGFLIIGAGNPLLLGPTAVTLHCLIIYIIIGDEKYSRKTNKINA